MYGQISCLATEIGLWVKFWLMNTLHVSMKSYLLFRNAAVPVEMLVKPACTSLTWLLSASLEV